MLRNRGSGRFYPWAIQIVGYGIVARFRRQSEALAHLHLLQRRLPDLNGEVIYATEG